MSNIEKIRELYNKVEHIASIFYEDENFIYCNPVFSRQFRYASTQFLVEPKRKNRSRK